MSHKKDVFMPADILLPDGVSWEKWSVIACDQFSSEPEYWERAREYISGEPSTLNMIIPEAYLSGIDLEAEAKRIGDEMERYAQSGLLRELKDSFIYVERTLPDGRARRGLVGAVDLDSYDFSGGDAAILASEDTVLDRLPVRVRVRRGGSLEAPHIIAFIDDKDRTIIEPLAQKSSALPLLYDFDLMEGGGHIRGMRVHGSYADEVSAGLRSLQGENGALLVMGDGNHSLAAAKVHWDEIKQNLSADERKTHPAGKALLEINNVYDPAISFEAIHRVVFDVDRESFMSAFTSAVPSGGDYELCWTSRDGEGTVGIRADNIGEMLAAVQSFLDEYTARTGCGIDYIHGEDTVRRLSQEERCLGLILPSMDKSELFATVTSGRVFPKKSFSVGHARDKRYYLECRRIKV